MTKKKLLKTMEDNDREQFKFTIEFQLELLKYIIQTKEAIVYLDKIKSSYFTLLEHAIICETLLRTYKKYKKVPGKVAMLEAVKNLLNTREYATLVLEDDLPGIREVVKEVYDKKVEDADIIKKTFIEFITFIELKTLNEATDFSDFDQYQKYYQRVGKLLEAAHEDVAGHEVSHYMVDDTVERQLLRRTDPDVIPSPYKQVNDLTNAGGYAKGSIVVMLDKAKARKTFTMINVARGYLSMKRNVLYIDTENGATQIMGRMIQSTLNRTKKDMLSGEYDALEKRHMRKYKRLGVEFIVRRVSALVDSALTIKNIIIEEEARMGKKIHMVVIDYAGKLQSIEPNSDDVKRLDRVYIELQNMAFDMDIDSIWTAHHTTRDGAKNQETRYEENDIAGAITIVRNAVAIWGLNATQDELDNNIQRWEVVVQRDGVPHGRALFNIDVERQRMKEFTRDARKAYDEQVGNNLDANLNKKKTAANYDATKSKITTGDI